MPFNEFNYDDSFDKDEGIDDSELRKRFYINLDEKPVMDEKEANLIIFDAFNKPGADINNDSFFMVVEKDSLEKIDVITGRCAKFR